MRKCFFRMPVWAVVFAVAAIFATTLGACASAPTAAGEYVKGDPFSYTRDWEKGVEFARVGIRGDGVIEVQLCKKNNSVSGYNYKRNPKAEGAEVVKLYETLSKYAGAKTEMWDEEVRVYYVDYARFDNLKAAVDGANGYYLSRSSWRVERDWGKGESIARVVLRPDGRISVEMHKSDNSSSEFAYKAGALETQAAVDITALPRPSAPEPKLAASIQKYAGYRTQNWDGKEVPIYSVDPRRFTELKAEVDAGGEYVLAETWTEPRNWDRGQTFAEVAVPPDGYIRLRLGTADNYWTEYRYKNSAGGTALGAKLAATIGKFSAPRESTNDDRTEVIFQYNIDAARFAAFKAEIDAGGEYLPVESETETRSWDKGMTFARISLFPNGRINAQLLLADNTKTDYRYSKPHKAGDTWVESWDEGKITFTFLGAAKPADFVLDANREGRGRAQLAGYYKMVFQDAQDGGHHTRYIYYPTAGRVTQYSNWLD